MTPISDSDLLALGRTIHKRLKGGRNRIAVYGVGWEDGETEELGNRACHMALKKRNYGTIIQVKLDGKGRGPVVISNKVQYDCDTEWIGRRELHKYYSFLFNESVFADCYVTKDPSTCIKEGVTVRTDLPANLVVAACIATRQAWEYPDIGLSVNRLIEFGVEPRRAHLAAHSIKVLKNGEFRESYRGGHVAVYSDSISGRGVSNFLTRILCTKVALNLVTYREARDYDRIPKMWGDNGNNLRIDCPARPSSDTSDPFNYIKHVGTSRKIDVVEAVNLAFERAMKK